MEWMEKMKERFAFSEWQHRLVLRWFRSYRRFFFLVLLVVVGWGMWVWYFNIYRYHWDDAQKKSYLDSTNNETVFRESKYQHTLDVTDNDRKRHMTDTTVQKELVPPLPKSKGN